MLKVFFRAFRLFLIIVGLYAAIAAVCNAQVATYRHGAGVPSNTTNPGTDTTLYKNDSTTDLYIWNSVLAQWALAGGSSSSITGGGTSGTIPIWSGALSLGNSLITYSSPRFSFGDDKCIRLQVAGDASADLCAISPLGTFQVKDSANLGTMQFSIGGLSLSAAGTGGSLTMSGATSGSAQIGVAAVAGSAAKINLPTSTGSSGQFLQTNGASPQQLSWASVSSTGSTDPSNPCTGSFYINTTTLTLWFCNGTTWVLSSGQPFAGGIGSSPAGGFVGNNFNAGGASTQLPFDSSTWRATTGYNLSPIALCTSTANAANTQMRLFPISQNFASTQTGTPNVGDTGTQIEQGATAGCRQGNGNLIPLIHGWRMGVNGENLGNGTPATIQGWAMRVYGSSDSPMTTRINTTVPLSSTRYINHNFGAFESTEANAAAPVPVDMTVRNFEVTTTGAQPATGSLDFKVRKNGTTDVCTLLSIPANGGIGRWPWTPTTCNLSEGEWYDIAVINNATSVSATITDMSWALKPQNTGLYSAIIPFPNGPNGSLADGDNYIDPVVSHVGVSATEINHRYPMITSLTSGITASHLYCKVAGSNPNALPVTIMRNGSTSSLTFSYTAGSTLVIGTNVATQVFNNLDSYSLKVNKLNNTSPTYFNCMMALSAE